MTLAGARPRSAAETASAHGPRPSWNVAIGNFFFRFRNALFPILILSVVLLARPSLFFGSTDADRALRLAGLAVALAGEAVRLITIGYEYIERGGKGGKVYASKLVQGGVYGLTRNPMYVGNTLIAIGVALFSGSPTTCAVVIPLFLFIYQAMMSAEEAFLRGKFGQEYQQYCREVSRIWPSFSRAPRLLSGLKYDWRRAVRKDLGTMAGLACGLIALPEWRRFWMEGRDAALRSLPDTLAWLAAALLGYALLHRLKKRRIFLYTAEELQEGD